MARVGSVGSVGAGDRYDRVAFERRTEVPDGDGKGNYEGPFLEQFKEWAAFQFLRGGESVLAARLTGVQPLVIIVPNTRRTREIDGTWRGREVKTGRYINIKSVSVNREDPGLLDILGEFGSAT
jgi:hypothetical protein